MKREKYIKHWYRGIFCESSNKRLHDQRAWPTPDEVKLPDGVYAFQFVEKVTRAGRLEDGEVIEKVTWQDASKTFFPGGVVRTREQIANTKDNEILLSNMRCNKWKYVVYAWPQIVLPFDPDKDEVIRDNRHMTRERWNAEHPDKLSLCGA